MARMPEGSPTKEIRAESWLPGETITIATYLGATDQADISDAVTMVDLDPGNITHVRQVTYTPNKSRSLRRRLAIKGWTLVYEGSGNPVPFTPENVDNLDPDYAAYVDRQLDEVLNAWKAAAGAPVGATNKKEAAAQQKRFSGTVARFAHAEDGPPEPAEVPA